MNALLIATVLAAPPTTTTESVEAAVEAVRSHAIDGTLLFSKGDCLAVKVYTASPYTHVAAVVVEDGKPYVYDAANGAGVRCQLLEEYIATVQPDRMQILRPRSTFGPRRAQMFRECLARELGRPYGVAHHLSGERAEGLHCSEYVTDALIRCRLLTAKSPARVSPASLHEGITRADLYAHVLTVELGDSPEPTEVGTNWCHQLWIDTKVCTSNFGRKLGRVFLCR